MPTFTIHITADNQLEVSQEETKSISNKPILVIIQDQSSKSTISETLLGTAENSIIRILEQKGITNYSTTGIALGIKEYKKEIHQKPLLNAFKNLNYSIAQYLSALHGVDRTTSQLFNSCFDAVGKPFHKVSMLKDFKEIQTKRNEAIKRKASSSDSSDMVVTKKLKPQTALGTVKITTPVAQSIPETKKTLEAEAAELIQEINSLVQQWKERGTSVFCNYHEEVREALKKYGSREDDPHGLIHITVVNSAVIDKLEKIKQNYLTLLAIDPNNITIFNNTLRELKSFKFKKAAPLMQIMFHPEPNASLEIGKVRLKV